MQTLNRDTVTVALGLVAVEMNKAGERVEHWKRHAGNGKGADDRLAVWQARLDRLGAAYVDLLDHDAGEY